MSNSHKKANINTQLTLDNIIDSQRPEGHLPIAAFPIHL